MKKRIAILPIVVFLCIASCGVKKNAAQQETQTNQTQQASLSLEQRVSAGEFAWLDTIYTDTSNSIKFVQGSYSLRYYEDKKGVAIYPPETTCDSLCLASNGFYSLYKHSVLIDYGRYCVTIMDTLKYCLHPFGRHSDEQGTEYPTYTMNNAMILNTYNYTHQEERYNVTIEEGPTVTLTPSLSIIPEDVYIAHKYKDLIVWFNLNNCYEIGVDTYFWRAQLNNH